MISEADIIDSLPFLCDRDRRDLDALLVSVRLKPCFVDHLFPEQRAFIEDPAQLKGLLCTRRAGKSFGIGLYHLKTLEEHPGVTTIYIGLTRESAKRIIWKDILEVLLERLGYVEGKDYTFNKTELSLTMANGSVLYILGMDSNEKEKRKAFGQKYKLATIDEAALYVIDLDELIYSVLQPAVADQGGTITLSGMPSNLKKGRFYELTKDLDSCRPEVRTVDDVKNGARWSVHCWSGWQNPHMRQQFETEVAKKKAINPRIEETPLFQQEWLGRWVIDDTKLVYRYSPGRNDFNGTLPAYTDGHWHYVLGCDLGYVDATALCLWAYHDHDQVAYCLKTEKRRELDVTGVAEWAKSFAKGFAIESWVIDGANKQAVEEMRNRHGIPWEAADKTGKADFIELMNSAFILGQIRIDPVRCAELAKEYAELIWEDVKAVPRVEHPACENHSTDASLYAWRKLYAYAARAEPPKPKHGTSEWQQLEAERMLEGARQRAERQQQHDPWGANPWGSDPFGGGNAWPTE